MQLTIFIDPRQLIINTVTVTAYSSHLNMSTGHLPTEAIYSRYYHHCWGRKYTPFSDRKPNLQCTAGAEQLFAGG